ncbi:MAG: hypothetical protein Ct9H300mP18_13550 [Candidatus Neomarinimicrobiota bacterium]|nr:MAG: hypothetical protein Ct9H300mP18_13550 [Candidatus Neomarinimicrobiota bacterium]
MMATSYYKINIENRKSVGKKASKVIRKAGKVPGYFIIKANNQSVFLLINKCFTRL